MNNNSPPPSEYKQSQSRPVLLAMTRGFANRCPSCGNASIFAEFLKTRDKCENCGTEFHHHRADDLPAYLVVLILGHIMVGFVMLVQATTNLGIWQQLAVITPITVLIAILLLRPVKGAVVGLQWALYMHGFGGNDENATIDAPDGDNRMNG